MRLRPMIGIFIILGITVLTAKESRACDSCVLPRLGRVESRGPAEEAGRFFVDFTFEQQNWDELDVRDAHELHEEGHHVHDKIHEEFYHFTAGAKPLDALTVLAEIPYVVRESIEIEEHDSLGEKETSEGFGDLSLIGVWRFLRNDDGHLAATGGVKFPTGETGEENSRGELFEPELQPGSGSYDYPVGVVYKYDIGIVTLRGNAIYVIKTEGDHDFRFGDLFTASFFLDVPLNPGNESVRVKAGLDLNFQHEDKQEEDGKTVPDSGGDTLFLGPTIQIEAGDHLHLFGTLLFPVVQDLGGMHQELDFVWTAGAKISW